MLSYAQNVVATVNLNCKLDLKEIALQARNAEYNPKVRQVLAALATCLAALFYTRARWCQQDERACAAQDLEPPSCMLPLCLQRFAAVIMRIREPKTTALIFASGKMVRGWQACFWV